MINLAVSTPPFLLGHTSTPERGIQTQSSGVNRNSIAQEQSEFLQGFELWYNFEQFCDIAFLHDFAIAQWAFVCDFFIFRRLIAKSVQKMNRKSFQA